MVDVLYTDPLTGTTGAGLSPKDLRSRAIERALAASLGVEKVTPADITFLKQQLQKGEKLSKIRSELGGAKEPSVFMDPTQFVAGAAAGGLTAGLGLVPGRVGIGGMLKEAGRAGVGFQTAGLSEVPTLVKNLPKLIQALRGVRGAPAGAATVPAPPKTQLALGPSPEAPQPRLALPAPSGPAISGPARDFAVEGPYTTVPVEIWEGGKKIGETTARMEPNAPAVSTFPDPLRFTKGGYLLGRISDETAIVSGPMQPGVRRQVAIDKKTGRVVGYLQEGPTGTWESFDRPQAGSYLDEFVRKYLNLPGPVEGHIRNANPTELRRYLKIAQQGKKNNLGGAQELVDAIESELARRRNAVRIVNPDTITPPEPPKGGGGKGGGPNKPGGPNSPYDGRPVFDPKIEPGKTPFETFKNRLFSFLRKQRERLPSELRLLKYREGTPVISLVEETFGNMTDRLNQLSNHGWFKSLRKYSDHWWTVAENKAYNTYQLALKAGLSNEAAWQKGLDVFPPEIRDYFKHRSSQFVKDNWARQLLDLGDIDHFAGMYIPRMAEDDVKTLGQTVFGGMQRDLSTTVSVFQRERKFATRLAGEAAGISYRETPYAILMREWFSIKMQETARLMQQLEAKGVIFKTKELAKAAGADKSYPLKGLPGSHQIWYFTNPYELQFIADNLSAPTKGSAFFRAVHWGNTLFRSPNLINPLPHIVKNMGYKYGQAVAALGGNPTKILPDAVEFIKKTNPEMINRFKSVMHFSEYSTTAHELLANEMAGKTTKFVENALRKLNKWSSNVIFLKADPAMRYSLWKQYVAKGFSDQEAANHVWVDLIRYGTRSQMVDFWKMIPLNFFVPWRVGTLMSFYKAAKTSPIKVGIYIGAIDILREMMWRYLGQWFHAPVDYYEGPVSKMIEDPSPTNIASILGTTAVFGPGGSFSARQIGDLLLVLRDPKHADYKRLRNMFWGIAQVYDLGVDAITGIAKMDPYALAKVLSDASLATRNSLSASPERFTKAWEHWIPSIKDTMKSPRVRRAEKIQEHREAALDRAFRTRMLRALPDWAHYLAGIKVPPGRPTIEDIVGKE